MYYVCVYSYDFLLLDLLHVSSLVFPVYTPRVPWAANMNHIYLEAYVAYMLCMFTINQKGLTLLHVHGMGINKFHFK